MRQASKQKPLASCWSLRNVHNGSSRIIQMISVPPGHRNHQWIETIFWLFLCLQQWHFRNGWLGFVKTHSMIQPIEDPSLLMLILLLALFACWKHGYKAKKHEKRGLELNLHKLTINVTKNVSIASYLGINNNDANSQNCTHVFKCRNVSGATMISQDMATCLICDLRHV